MAFLVPADIHEPLREVVPENGTDFKLAELYRLLSCDTIEILPIAGGLIMVLDEEGKLTAKPRNKRITRVANFVTSGQLIAELLRARDAGIAVVRIGDPITDLTTEADSIAGDALICTGD
jgi:hypothetical protein